MRDAHLRGFDGFGLRGRETDRALGLVRRDGVIAQKFLLPLRVRVQELQRRFLRFDIATGGIDLRLGEVTLRGQFGCIELHNRIAFFQSLAFARENLFHPAARTRRDVDFIDFDRAGNAFGFPLTAGEEKEKEKEKAMTGLQDERDLNKVRKEVESFARMAGYSETPLLRKLGIRPNEQIVALNAPAHYSDLLGELPEVATMSDRLTAGAAFVHLFVTRRADLEKRLVTLRAKLDDAGILWISWPKKASKVATDITENTIREVALPLGFVDVKICAVDEVWSGLKLMVRRTNRLK